MSARLVVNFMLFQLGWFACVLGAAANFPWSGTLIVLAIIAFHLVNSPRPEKELQLIAMATLIGVFWDSLLLNAGLLNFQNGLVHEAIAPHWIIAMWALFATTLNVSMTWMRGRYLLASLFGAVGGPLAYYAGFKLGAVAIPNFMMAMLVLAIGWALIMPLLVWLSERYNGFDNAPAHSGPSGEAYHV